MNIKKLLIGPSIRIKYVNRFSTCRTLHKESVAEHVYFTMLYSRVIGWWVWKVQRINVNFGKLLLKALIHDMEECLTGDIPRDFKHSDPILKKVIEGRSGELFSEVLQDIFEDDAERVRWFDVWKNAKDDTVEGKIVAFADFLSVISYVYEEMRMASSLSLKEHLTSLKKYYTVFEDEKYEFLQELLLQVKPILFEEILHDVEC